MCSVYRETRTCKLRISGFALNWQYDKMLRECKRVITINHRQADHMHCERGWMLTATAMALSILWIVVNFTSYLKSSFVVVWNYENGGVIGIHVPFLNIKYFYEFHSNAKINYNRLYFTVEIHCAFTQNIKGTKFHRNILLYVSLIKSLMHNALDMLHVLKKTP